MNGHSDDYVTYEDIMADMDDRDDSNDPEFRDPDGYCEHGTYVGGCGIDWMCQWRAFPEECALLRSVKPQRWSVPVRCANGQVRHTRCLTRFSGQAWAASMPRISRKSPATSSTRLVDMAGTNPTPKR